MGPIYLQYNFLFFRNFVFGGKLSKNMVSFRKSIGDLQIAKPLGLDPDRLIMNGPFHVKGNVESTALQGENSLHALNLPLGVPKGDHSVEVQALQIGRASCRERV